MMMIMIMIVVMMMMVALVMIGWNMACGNILVGHDGGVCDGQ